MAKMLDRVLSRMASRKDKGRDKESEPHTLCIRTGGVSTSPKEDSQEGEIEASSPRGKKRAASEDLEAEIPKLGEKGSPGVLASTGTLTASCPPTGQPSNEP